MDYIVCRVGKSDEKKATEQSSYNNEILDYVKANIQTYIRQLVEEDTTV